VDRAVNTGMNLLDRIMGRGGSSEENEISSNDPEKQQRVDAGLAEIDQRETSYLSGGKITLEQARIVALEVKRRHPVFTTLEAVDGNETWNYVYTASPPATKTGPPKALILPSGNPEVDWQLIEAGNLMDLTNYNNPEGQKMNLDRNFISNRDRRARTNRQRASAGLTSFLSHNDFVELHHNTQNFFSPLDEHSHSFHQSVVDDPDYHPMAGDAGYISWRGEVGWFHGQIRQLGYIYNLVRQRYWRRRYN
jgi:hypothetical protein